MQISYAFKKSYKKILVSTVLIVISLFLIFTFFINRQQPAKTDIEAAHILIESLEKIAFNESPLFFSEPSNGAIHINSYGLIEVNDQNKVIDHLNLTIKKHPYAGDIYVHFFSPREFSTHHAENGIAITKLNKKEALRSVQIH